MRATPPELSGTDHLTVRPWFDPVVDQLGHDPRSAYVESFWLGVLGPSTTWLLRRFADGLDESPEGFELPLRDTARALGLGGDGRSSPFMRALTRCCQFDVARPAAGPSLEVRRRLPPLNLRQLARLPEPVQDAHRRWVEADLRPPAEDQLRRRARRLALSLVELGENRDETERQLVRWRFERVLAAEATQWAWEAHARALTGSAMTGPVPAEPAPVAEPTTLHAPTPDGPAAA